MKQQQQKLKELIDNKDDDYIRTLSLAHILSQQHSAYYDLEKWKNTEPYLALDQAMIDSVIKRFDKQIDILDYIEYALRKTQ